MKNLLTLTALVEAGAGLALMAVPSAVVALLLGSGLDTVAAVTLGRMTGATLFSLGTACWIARTDAAGRAARGLVAAMLLYNVAVVVLFTFVGLGPGPRGVALWPAVILHTALAGWCLAGLGNARSKTGDGAQP